MLTRSQGFHADVFKTLNSPELQSQKHLSTVIHGCRLKHTNCNRSIRSANHRFWARINSDDVKVDGTKTTFRQISNHYDANTFRNYPMKFTLDARHANEID